MSPNADHKLYQALEPEHYEDAPLALLLSHPLEQSFTEYPMPYLIAMELPEEHRGRYARLIRGRRAS
jgi:hypothetical protein